MAGRPTKCTPELTGKVAAALRAGLSIRGACRAVGINESTYYDWVNRGEESEAPFDAFAAEVGAALSDFEQACVTTVVTAIESGDTGAAMWALARRFSKDWGPSANVSRTEPADDGGGGSIVIIPVLSD